MLIFLSKLTITLCHVLFRIHEKSQLENTGFTFLSKIYAFNGNKVVYFSFFRKQDKEEKMNDDPNPVDNEGYFGSGSDWGANGVLGVIPRAHLNNGRPQRGVARSTQTSIREKGSHFNEPPRKSSTPSKGLRKDDSDSDVPPPSYVRYTKSPRRESFENEASGYRYPNGSRAEPLGFNGRVYGEMPSAPPYEGGATSVYQAPLEGATAAPRHWWDNPLLQYDNKRF